MNRKLIVSLLKRNIQELDMITEGFMEMTEYPKPIILLAQRKTEEIQSYINQLSAGNIELLQAETTKTNAEERIEIKLDKAIEIVENPVQVEAEKAPEVVETIEVVEEIKNTIEVEEPQVDITAEVVTTLEPETTVVEIVEVSETPQNESVTLTQTQETKKTVETTRIDTITLTAELKTETRETKSLTDETKKTILGERNVSATPSRNESMSKADNSISATLANKKITDIKQAINIGDRFRFQRELFKANGEDMNKTLSYINQLATLEEVMSFLQSKYSWETDNETAEDFYQIVRRKFL